MGKSIIIIGGGLAGLSTGCYARMNGYQTRIFEQHALPGGVCTSWKRKGYTIDGCIHWLMSSQAGGSFRQIYDELGAFHGNRLMIVNHFCRFYEETEGRSLLFSSDLSRLRADMTALAPEDEEAIDELISACQDLTGFDLGIPEPKELMGPLQGLRSLWQVRKMIKYVNRFKMPVLEYAERFKNPFLRYCILNLFVKEMPAYFLFAVLGQLAGRQLGVVEGGSQKFSDAIALRYRELGGEIHYRSPVERVLVEGHKAVGVRLEDGSEHRADIVVSAADGHATIFGMLQGEYIDDQIRSRFDTWPLYTPIMLLSYGINRQFAGDKPSHVIRLQKPLLVLNQEVEHIFLRVFNYDPTLSPPGRTVIQIMLETEWEGWNKLKEDDERYAAEKQRVAEQGLEILERLFPGSREEVEMTDVATPYTFWHYTRNYRGSYEGWLMTAEAVQTQVSKTLPGLANFYMAGQWVEPGGGIPPALYSGRNLVKLLCKQDRKRFTVTTSS